MFLDPIDKGQIFTVAELRDVLDIFQTATNRLEDKGMAYAASKGFKLLQTISPGEGFWVNAKEESTIE